MTRAQELRKNEENRWIPPKGDYVKVNFDGALSTLKQKASMRIIIHNSKGESLAIRNKLRSMCSPVLVESDVALLGIHTTITMGVKKIIVEGDAKIVTEALRNPLEEALNEIRNCIDECKELLKNFDNFIIQHASRNRNNVTHLVAKSRFEKDSLNIALGLILNEIQSAIDKEMRICTNIEV